MSINWQNLRPFNGSQHSAFEELCCQLASAESVPPGSIFIRKGAPDAGIECYWKLPDHSEWGWQAKFFLSPPDAGQWAQIDGSVHTALEKHPFLSRYMVCLPIDRQDPRIDNQKWFMDKWNECVDKWKGWAASKSMSVVFEYWGVHEIFDRLSKEENRGRNFFWFHQELFSQEWFQSRIEEAIANVGPRYTPELNVQLPIARLFQGLGRTPEFYLRVKELLKKVKKATPRRDNIYLPEKSKYVNEELSGLWKLLGTIDDITVNLIDRKAICSKALSTINAARDCSRDLFKLAEVKKQETPSSKELQHEIERIQYLASDHQVLWRELEDLIEYIESDEVHLANLPALLLVAEAGRGKTHLFCDIARRRVLASTPTVLLIGGQFNRSEPWTQIIQLLGLSCTKEEFLGSLEAAAQIRGRRAVILIDAINEGEGKTLWKEHLAGFLLTISKFPWLGVAISVRTSYEDAIIPEGLVPSRLNREMHHGFADNEYEATRIFFNYFGIAQPSIPLLVPEFQNPLFLKIFCQGLKNNGLTSIPSGLQGITAVFRFFIDSVNKKLSDSRHLDFNPNIPIVWRAIEALAAQLAIKGTDWLPLEKAQEVINQVLPRSGYENSLFRLLLAEGVISENRFYVGENQWSEGVHFAYERFMDHLIAKYLLDAHLDPNDPISSFTSDKPLFKYLRDLKTCSMHQGLIEAWSIQFPERIGIELIELIPSIADYRPIVTAFIESIVWRDPQFINIDVARKYINTYIIRNPYLHERFLDALLTVAVNPAHPLNADFLHQNLLKKELANRDAWWSTFLHEQYKTHGAVDRLVDWAWSPESKVHIADESIRLCGTILAWFLTTSNRFLRDRATKSLVQLFTDRISILGTLIRNFMTVNDPYVLERIMAIAYGCSMRSQNSEAIGNLALDIYNLVFKEGRPPVHILLRDYARGVVEVALNRGIALDIDINKIRPPYNSKFPSNIPTEEELKAKYNNFDKAKRDIDYAQSSIWHSVMTYGDFARYIIGTNHGMSSWSSRRLSDPHQPTRKEQYDAFVAKLTPKQKHAFESYEKTRNIVSFCRRLDRVRREEIFKTEITDEQLDQDLQEADKAMRKQLGRKKLEQLSSEIIRYIDNPNEDEFRFDLSMAQKWILQRVFELGWTVERFGQFDRNVEYGNGRQADKPERIGKKYQWIAYHEFLARVADNFEFRGWMSNESNKKYDGPWELSIRDIDPSWVLPRTEESGGWHGFDPTWWAPVQIEWNNLSTDKEWVSNPSDLPPVESLIDVRNQDESHWLTLTGSYLWETVSGNKDDYADYPKRSFRYFLQSYIVKQEDCDGVCEWIKGQWLATKDLSLPETHSTYYIFFGENYWAPASLYNYQQDGWIGGGVEKGIPRPILLTNARYSWEGKGFDCSIVEGVGVYTPCKWLADHMDLTWTDREAHFYDKAGNLVAFDPSVHSAGPSVLLVNRELFMKYISDNGYSIIWVVTGEKVVITSTFSGEDWHGRLHLFGLFSTQEGKVLGKLETSFRK